MGNVAHKQSAAVHPARKHSARDLFLVVLTVALAIGLTVAWLTLIGYGFFALFKWIAG